MPIGPRDKPSPLILHINSATNAPAKIAEASAIFVTSLSAVTVSATNYLGLNGAGSPAGPDVGLVQYYLNSTNFGADPTFKYTPGTKTLNVSSVSSTNSSSVIGSVGVLTANTILNPGSITTANINAAYGTISELSSVIVSATTYKNLPILDHGTSLSGLGDNDHPQYVLSSTNANLSSLVSNIQVSAGQLSSTLSGHLASAVHWDLTTLNNNYINASGDSANASFFLQNLSATTFSATSYVNLPSSTLVWRQAQDIVLYVKNNTATPLPKGTPVAIVGAVGDNPLVEPLSSVNTHVPEAIGFSNHVAGLVQETITGNGFGYIVVEGIVVGTGADKLDTNSFTAGDWLYVSSNGQLNNVRPPAPYESHPVGIVLRPNENNGVILVKIENVSEINDIVGFNLNTNLINGDLIVYDRTTSTFVNRQSIDVSGLIKGGSLSATNLSATNARITSLSATTLSATTYLNLPSGVATWNASALQGFTVTGTTPVANDVLMYNGTVWTPSSAISLASVTATNLNSTVANFTNNSTTPLTLSSTASINQLVIRHPAGNSAAQIEFIDSNGNRTFRLYSSETKRTLSIGRDAGAGNFTTTGINAGVGNTYLGDVAGQANVSGNNNTYLGYQAGGVAQGSNNVAVGFQAMVNNNTSSNDNIAVGRVALRSSVGNPTGGGNIGIGFDANGFLSGIGATNNVAIGHNANSIVSQYSSLTNTIAIGANSRNTASNQTVIGNSSTSSTILFGTVSVSSVSAINISGTNYFGLPSIPLSGLADTNITTGNIATGRSLVWNGSRWQPSSITGGATSLSSLLDTSVGLDANTNPSGNQALVYSSSVNRWYPGYTVYQQTSIPSNSLGKNGDIYFQYDQSSTLSGLSDTAITSPGVGQVLAWNASKWIASSVTGGAGASPFGSNYNFQFYNDGQFSSVTGITLGSVYQPGDRYFIVSGLNGAFIQGALAGQFCNFREITLFPQGSLNSLDRGYITGASPGLSAVSANALITGSLSSINLSAINARLTSLSATTVSATTVSATTVSATTYKNLPAVVLASGRIYAYRGFR